MTLVITSLLTHDTELCIRMSLVTSGLLTLDIEYVC